VGRDGANDRAWVDDHFPPYGTGDSYCHAKRPFVPYDGNGRALLPSRGTNERIRAIGRVGVPWGGNEADPKAWIPGKFPVGHETGKGGSA
jgi:hypothetical protein